MPVLATFRPICLYSEQKLVGGEQFFPFGPARPVLQVEECFQKEQILWKDVFLKGSNTCRFGEMGIGNTSTSSVLGLITEIPLVD